jgi:hypothetical protein
MPRRVVDTVGEHIKAKASVAPQNDKEFQAMDLGLLQTIRQIWENARSYASRTVNTTLVQANWLIGRQIVEAQQGGKGRAAYGEGLLRRLSLPPCRIWKRFFRNRVEVYAGVPPGLPGAG